MELGKLLTAMVTPFDSQGNLDLDRAKELVEKLFLDGSDGVVAVGTTGESPTMTHEEKLKLFRALLEVSKPAGKSMIAGTGTNDTQGSIELTREAEALGADGILLVNPYYNKPSQEGLYQHFAAIARSTRLPVILYNHPGRTGVNLQPETLARLMEIPNLAGIKDASGNLETASQYLRVARPGFHLYSGDDSLTLPIMALGGHGVISVASHLMGKEMRRLIELCDQNDYAGARMIHFRYFELFKGLFATPSPAPVKTALALTGFPVGEGRLPIVPMNEGEKRTLVAMLERCGLLTQNVEA